MKADEALKAKERNEEEPTRRKELDQTTLVKQVKRVKEIEAIESDSFCPDWYGSVGWASSHKLKDHQWDSPSGHMPGLKARSLVVGVLGAWERQPTLMFSSSLSLSILVRMAIINKSANNKCW